MYLYHMDYSYMIYICYLYYNNYIFMYTIICNIKVNIISLILYIPYDITKI